MQSTLVLNASYEPLSVVSSSRAINLILANKAMSVDDSETIWRSTKNEINVPYVIRMNYFIKRSKSPREVPFSRHGVLVRDNYRCGYCGKRNTDNMTIDHIIPKSKGGQHSWENCVTSCLKCNAHKKDSTLAQSGLKLRIKPIMPNVYSSFLLKVINHPPAFQAWSSYVFMYSPDLKEHFKNTDSINYNIAHLID